MARKVLVTGATGTIGSELVAHLSRAGAEFDVMTSNPTHTTHGVPARHGSFDDVAQLTSAFEGVETLFVLLPLVPHKVRLAQNVAAAAVAAGVTHIVRSSGAGADANAAFSLPRLQGTIDDLLAATGIPTTFLRNAGFMQNYVTSGASMIKAGMWFGATADAAQSLVDVRDIAAVAALILQAPGAHAGKAYTLTGGESLTDTERMAIVSAAVGRPVGFTPISIDAAATAMKQEWGLSDVMVDWLSSLNQIISAGYASGVSPDVAVLLDRAPITFAQFAHDYAPRWR